MNKLIVASLILYGFFSNAEKLSDRLTGLPEYFAKKYASSRLNIIESKKISKLNDSKVILRKTRINSMKDLPAMYSEVMEFVVPQLSSNSSPQSVDDALAAAFVRYLESEDSQYNKAVRSLDKLSFLIPNEEGHTVPSTLLTRIRAFAAATFVSKTPEADEIVKTWWNLKFSEANKIQKDTAERGEQILLAIRQYGYSSSSGNFITKMRRKLDFGHAALGVRTLGAGPENDLFINPGAKDFSLGETSLPTKEDAKVLNAVDVTNLWHWLNVQIYKRYMQVQWNALILNDMQKSALAVLIPKAKGVAFGPAVLFSNDCVDGSARLINFLLHIENVFDPSYFGNFATPKGYLADSKDAFPSFMRQRYEFKNIKDQNPEPTTPPVSYKNEPMGDLEKTPGFIEWKVSEEKLLKKNNSL